MTVAPETPLTDRQEAASSRVLIARVARTYLKPRWKGLAVAALMAALVALFTAVLARLLEPATNGIFGQEKPARFHLIPLAIVAAALVRGLCQAIQATLVNRTGHRIVGDVQVGLFERLMRADLAHLRASHTGGFVSSMLYDAGLIREAATNGVINYVQHGLTVFAMILVMAFLDPVLTGIVLVAAPVSTAVMRRYAKRTRKAAKGAMQETSSLSTAMMEGLDGIKIVKINNREAEETARVAAVVARRQRHIIKGANARAYAAPATETLTMMVTAAVIAYAGWRSSSGGMNGGEFTSFIASLGIASQSLRQLANMQSVMSEGLTAAKRLFAALDVEPEVGDSPGARPLEPGRADIRFQNVSFAYGDGVRVLDGVDLEVRAGASTALVGPSGGGKSSILNLIPRFYDVSGGRVSVDGSDVRDVTLHSLREHIALVTQEPFLFDDTVRANIAYAQPGAPMEVVEAAARAAAAHDFILALPDGYETVVGEAGARLSGGQRQRIAIARAFLKDAPILLLDEATSALDTHSEIQVQAALDRLMAGRTTLMIAHRLSTVRNCDRIYVIDRGRVVEQGDHESLLASGGLYSRLARAQHLDSPLAMAADVGL
ncbi:MAG TPA: ABC transporter transmembrane domain-containing protein [Caulobacteraceae bacterium]|jgi:subfamily B ATP-binding cassette protein MsbA|nr:ABC transporter transmembrane domain-containing protein [Caulobacteraceae bacterium]